MVTDEVRQARGEWLSALRSGAYKQGGGMLMWNGNPCGTQHCCLGVALDATEYPDMVYATQWMSSFDDEAAYRDLERLFGLNPKLRGYLVSMNDGGNTGLGAPWSSIRSSNARQRSFEFIARFLEVVFALEAQGGRAS